MKPNKNIIPHCLYFFLLTKVYRKHLNASLSSLNGAEETELVNLIDPNWCSSLQILLILSLQNKLTDPQTISNILILIFKGVMSSSAY